MNIIVAPLAAVVIGLFVRSRFHGILLYLTIQSLFFTFQTLTVLLAWMSGEGGFGGATDQGAFGPAPTELPLTFSEGEMLSYGAVNLALICIGIGILLGVMALRNRSRVPRAQIDES